MWIRYAVAIFCALAGALFLTVNSILLARGAARWGLEPWEKFSYGAVAATVPWVIAIVPFLLKASLTSRYRIPTGWTAAGVGIWAVFVVYNVIGASGAISFVRNDVVATRAHDLQVEKQARDRRASLVSRRDAIGQVRPASAVNALVAAEKARPQWQWSAGCTQINYSVAKFCASLEKLKAESAASVELDKIAAEIAAIDAKLSTSGPVAEEADPQAALVASVTGLEERTVARWLPVMTPIVLELGSMTLLGFALFLMGLDHGARLERRPAASAAAAMPIPVPPPLPPLAPLESRQAELARWFFSQCVRHVSDGALPEADWYRHYCAVCRRSNDVPMSVEKFREVATAYVPKIAEVSGTYYYQRVLPLIPAA
jgi:hypothetical protein